MSDFTDLFEQAHDMQKLIPIVDKTVDPFYVRKLDLLEDIWITFVTRSLQILTECFRLTLLNFVTLHR